MACTLSATASAAGITAQPGCVRDGAWESSVSSACASMPLASAAVTGGGEDPRSDDGCLACAAELGGVGDGKLPRS